MNKIQNWLDESMEFEGTLGMAIANHNIKNLPGEYIFDNGFINVTADPEIPIMGLVILGTNKPYSSICEFTNEQKMQIYNISDKLIDTLHHVGFNNIIQFQDEGSDGQFHIWFLPRHNWTYQFGNNLDDMAKYSKTVLNISSKYRKSLLDCISTIKTMFINQIEKETD